jgi:hypothetical protein
MGMASQYARFNSIPDHTESTVQPVSDQATSLPIAWPAIRTLGIASQGEALRAYGSRVFGPRFDAALASFPTAKNSLHAGLAAALAIAECQGAGAFDVSIAEAGPQAAGSVGKATIAVADPAPTDGAAAYRKMFHPHEDARDALVRKFEASPKGPARDQAYSELAAFDRSHRR